VNVGCAASVWITPTNGAKYELIVSECNGTVPERLRGTMGYYAVIEEPNMAQASRDIKL
jgi:hypothetical protein